MSLDVQDVASKMIEAAKGVVGEKWPVTSAYFVSESRMFAERFAAIARMRAEGVISEERARSHVAFQKDAWETVLVAAYGLTQLMVEQALNAALDAVRDVVNAAVGFALI